MATCRSWRSPPTCSRWPRRSWRSKVAEFDPKTFRDRYEEALLAHLKAKQADAVREEKPPFAAPRPVINLMEALRRSIAQDQKRAGQGASAIPATRKRA